MNETESEKLPHCDGHSGYYLPWCEACVGVLRNSGKMFTVSISRRGFEASWDMVSPHDRPRIIKDACRTRWNYVLYGTKVELLEAAHDLECLGSAWLADGQQENRKDAKAMIADAVKIRSAIATERVMT